ncbi:MAG: vitamin B12 dependent methionine synthase [Acidobacteriota bacterium]
METIILDKIAFAADEKDFFGALKLHPDSGMFEDAARVFRQARELVRPKAVYMAAVVERLGEDCIIIDGVTFTSRLLRINLANAQSIYPFLATCGEELEDWAGGINDMLESSWADMVMTMALDAAVSALQSHLQGLVQGAKLSRMNPGSLAAWPIEQQKPLIELLDKGAEAIGMRLTDQYLLRPFKSVSGIQFVAKDYFVNCLLCPREGCQNRELPYDEGLWDKYGGN